MSEESASPFDAIRHEGDGGEYWSARELAQLLGYTRWQQFPGIITKAQIACEASGHAVSDHFQDTSHMIATGKGARRRVDDVHLSRYACYLVVQNADPEKPVVALGQTYFAVQTREQELTTEMLTRMSEEQQRLFWRDDLIRRNRRLASTAQGAGVIKPKDFALFQDHGYMGLYNGETARDIAERKQLAKGEHILDWMESEELAANIFRVSQTDAKIKRDRITTRDEANVAHYQVGRAVRKTIVDLGGTMPEDLPTPERSIQEIERDEQRRLQQRAQAGRQPSLFESTDDE